MLLAGSLVFCDARLIFCTTKKISLPSFWPLETSIKGGKKTDFSWIFLHWRSVKPDYFFITKFLMSSNIPWEECIIFHFRDKLSSILSIFCVISIDWMCGHCSEKRGLFLMKWDSQMASKFAMSLEHETTPIVFSFYFSWVTKKNIIGFCIPKIWLENFELFL